MSGHPPSAPGVGLIRLVSYLVPPELRDDWVREWTAELAVLRRPPPAGARSRGRLSAYLRSMGAVEDALWIRYRRRRIGMLRQDLRYALRCMVREPGFAAVVLVTLAIGIGANAAIFTLVDAVLLRPLPVNAPSELTDVWTTCRRGFAYCSSSFPDYVDYRDRNRTLEDMAAFAPATVSLNVDGDTRLVEGSFATGNYFDLLGIQPAVGRLLVRSDDQRGAAQQVAVLSFRFWTQEFGREPEVVGRTVHINGTPFTVIGVAAPGFRGTRLSRTPALWIPMNTTGAISSRAGDEIDILSERGFRWIGGLIGRRRPGVTVAQARADLLRVSDQLQEEYPDRSGRRVTVEGTRTVTLPAAQTGADLVRFVLLLMGAVTITLLIACANIAGLMIARATARRREIGVRIALGAGRARLVRQLITESLVYAGGGAILGLVAASLALEGLTAFSLPGFVSIADLGLGIDRRVLLFTTGITLVTGLLFGLVPARQSSKPEVVSALKDGGARGGGSAGQGMRSRAVLLGFQTALAFVLLAGAALFVRSLQNGFALDVGFRVRELAIATVDPELAGYSPEQARQLRQTLIERVQTLPVVKSVSTTRLAPLSTNGFGFFVSVDGYVPAPDEEIRIEANWVGPNYFTTMGIPLRSGRDISPRDRAGAPFVAVINETMANRWWSGEDPVGRTFRLNADGSGPTITVVGVAHDVKSGLVEDPEPFVYYPDRQFPERAVDFSVIAATTGPATTLLPSLRAMVREIDPDLPIAEITTVHNRFAEFLMPQRMGTTLLSVLGVFTALLAAIGILGIVRFSVHQQQREIGIRVALGAPRRHVFAVVMRGALIPVAAGIGIGVVASVGASRFIESFMYNVETGDPRALLVVALGTAAVALLASYLPARRALTVRPMEALRSE